MPRPRHPIRELFHEIPDSARKNGAISCNFCNKELSAGNPKRCQKHLNVCPQYAQFLAATDAGESTFPFGNPYEAQQQHVDNQAYAGAVPDGMHPQQHNNFANTTTGVLHPVVSTPDRAMSEENIVRALRINDTTYLTIEREMDAQLQSLNISGAGLHTQTGRSLLKQVFYQIHTRWPEVFNELPEQDKSQALHSMAHICNRKRRNGAPPSAGTSTPSHAPSSKMQQTPVRYLATPGDIHQQLQQHAEPTPPTATPQGPPQIFGTSTIIAERTDGSGAFVVCRPSDLLEEPRSPEDITVNDVKFMPFIDLLQHDDDVMFDPALDKLVHTFTGGRTKGVSNEVIWRVALEELHRKGVDPYVFRIYKRTN